MRTLNKLRRRVVKESVPSLQKEVIEGRLGRALRIAVSGYLCGKRGAPLTTVALLPTAYRPLHQYPIAMPSFRDSEAP